MWYASPTNRHKYFKAFKDVRPDSSLELEFRVDGASSCVQEQLRETGKADYTADGLACPGRWEKVSYVMCTTQTRKTSTLLSAFHCRNVHARWLVQLATHELAA